jgi:type I restriction enzyme S subunit
MKKYDSYKDSGVEWIGKIPTNWTAKRFSYSIAIQKGKIPKNLTSEKLIDSLPYLSMGVLRGDKPMEFSNENGIVHVSKGDIGLLWDGSNSGEVIRINREGILSSTVSLLSLKDNSINKEFCFYLLKFYENDFKENTIGMGIPHVSGDHVRESKLIIPPYSEQLQIVFFLHTKTSHIDTLIEKTQRKIELLKEKRISIINEVVTKGLNPNVEMKDSGVEWIGEIPSHWTFSSFRFCLDVLTDFTANGSFASLADNVDYLDSGFSRLVRLTDLRKNLSNNGIYVSEKAHKFLSKSELKGGELLIANVGAYAGLVTLMPRLNGFFTLAPNMFLLKLNQNHKYFSYLLSSSICAERLKLMAVSSAQPKLNKDNIRELKVVYPSLAEQEVIVSYLNEETQKIDSSISKEEERIKLLQEYRKSLISSVITGKIKVTEDA